MTTTPETSNFIDTVPAMAPDVQVDQQQSFMRRHAAKLLLSGAIVGGAYMAYPHVDESIDSIKENAAWTIPAIVSTEVLWNAGAATMIVAAGAKVGNPLKIRSKLKEVKNEVIENTTFRVGRAVNMAGEIGTASLVTVGTIATLPKETWPITFATLGALAAPSITVWRATRREAAEEAQ